MAANDEIGGNALEHDTGGGRVGGARTRVLSNERAPARVDGRDGLSAGKRRGRFGLLKWLLLLVLAALLVLSIIGALFPDVVLAAPARWR